MGVRLLFFSRNKFINSDQVFRDIGFKIAIVFHRKCIKSVIQKLFCLWSTFIGIKIASFFRESNAPLLSVYAKGLKCTPPFHQQSTEIRRQSFGQTTVSRFGLKFGKKGWLNCGVKKKVLSMSMKFIVLMLLSHSSFMEERINLPDWLKERERQFKSHKIYFPLINQVSASSVRNRAYIHTDAH